MSREEAVAQLQALGVTLGRGGDVATLKASIAKRDFALISRPLRAFAPEVQCVRKAKYATRDAALKAAKRIGNTAVVPYECVYCHGWHNGNPPSARGR